MIGIILSLESLILQAIEPAQPAKQSIELLYGFFGILIGFVPTAIFTAWKIRAIKSEILSKRIELMEKIKDAENAYTEACDQTTISMTKFMTFWDDDDNSSLNDERDILCQTINSKVIPNLKYFAELTVQKWQCEPQRQLSFVNVEVGAQVKRIKGWVHETVNHHNLLEEIGKEPYIISRESVVGLIDIALECNKTVKDEASKSMKFYIEELVHNDDAQDS